jgi:hypothetical protein
VLEGVDGGDPRDHRAQRLQVVAARAVGVLRGIELPEVREGQELHAHAGHLRELHGAAAVGDQRVVRAEQAVEGVARLVHHGDHVAVQACRVHEDERPPASLALVLVAARGLALAALKVQAVAGAHAVEHGAELGVHHVEHPARAVDELVRALEGPQRAAALQVHLQVPRAQLRQAEGLRALGVQAAHQRHADLLGALVEALAVGGRVVEALHARVLVVAEVLEAGIERDPVPQREHAVEEVVDPVGVLQAALRDRFPAGLAARAVGLLQVLGHLRQRPLLALEGDGHGAVDLAVLLVELGDIGLDRDVGLAEELDRPAQAAQQHAVAGRVEAGGERALDHLAVELEAGLLQLGLHLLDEVEEAPARELVVGVPGHPDVEVGRGLLGRGVELAAVEEQALQAVGVVDRASQELGVEGLQHLPLRGVERRRHEGRGGRGGGGGVVSLHGAFLEDRGW